MNMFDPWVVLSNLSDPVTLLLMTLSACFGIIMGARHARHRAAPAFYIRA